MKLLSARFCRTFAGSTDPLRQWRPRPRKTCKSLKNYTEPQEIQMFRFQRAHPLHGGALRIHLALPLQLFPSRNLRCRRDKRKWPRKGGILLRYAPHVTGVTASQGRLGHLVSVLMAFALKACPPRQPAEYVNKVAR